ncbi:MULTISPECIES: GNAT family N-acetyltransferase [unclassified Streptomyces]|uniref:GNAT family N-acetyltransferase n=1 Tax=unclassified Streptomyces TaxID=2593676 RepID=UPI0011CE3425|nr:MULTISPECIES: GNAT family protein [unclassified Streptomyces]TXS73669.1 N-acetyltransferase [Streptomyces sp. me109]
MEPVSLTTERLLIRPHDARDEDALLAACQDPEIGRWTDFPVPYERRHAAFYLRALVPRGWRDDTMYHFAVERRGDGDGILLASVNVHRQGDVWGVGYWTVAEHRGRGYATEAVGALARWAFTELGVQRLEWRAEAGNRGSWAVARKAGFVWEGAMRAAQTGRGGLRDTWIGALLPGDLGLPFALPYRPAADDLQMSQG